MNYKLKPLCQQTMVIAGASSGIGLVTARRAAKAGAKVMLVSRNGAALADICAEIRSAGGVAEFAVADVGDETQVRAAASRAVELFGGIDTWVNVAGVAIYQLLQDTPLDEHQRLFRTNYWGVVNGSLAAVKHLRLRGGALITVGSIVSDFGAPVLGAYAASKHAAKGFIDSLRIELLGEKAPVSVTLIKPSGIATPLGEHARNHMSGEARIPPVVYAPEIVADAILHAAEHPRREITIGGVGRQQALFAVHFPWLSDRLSILVQPLLSDRSLPKTRTDNLFEPATDGQTRARHESARRFSTYTSAQLHPVAAAGAAVLAGLTIAAVSLGRRRRRR